MPQYQTESVSRLIGADSNTSHKSYFAFHESQHREFPPEHLYISMFIKNKQINSTTAAATTTTPTTKGFNRVLLPFQRDVALLLPFRVASRNTVRHQKSEIKIIQKRARNPDACLHLPFLCGVNLRELGVFPLDVETFIGNLWPCPRAPRIKVFPLGTSGTFSLIQIQADSALAGELYSADI